MTPDRTRRWGGHTVVGKLRRVLVFPPVDHQNRVSWEDFGYVRAMNHDLATREHEALRQILQASGAEVITGEIEDYRQQDAIFPFDPMLITDSGAVLLRMGKSQRELEVDLAEATLHDLGIPIIGRISAPGTVEGGDCLWLDTETLAVGRGYRTNTEGIRQLREILGAQGIRVLAYDLPHWNGPNECLHLLSLISLVDDNLAVVYRPLMATAFIQDLIERGIELIDVPDDEFITQGTNVLALGPRDCLLLKENEFTAQQLRDAGCRVQTYSGDEISHNRTGGPTCLTRPLLRDVGQITFRERGS